MSKGRYVPLPWQIKIADSRESAIERQEWRWQGYESRSQVAHIAWNQEELFYKTLCGLEYSTPFQFAPDHVKRCKRCQATIAKVR